MYKFKGKKSEFIPGVPARDLSIAEFNALPDELKEVVKKSGLYVNQADTNKKPDKTQE